MVQRAFLIVSLLALLAIPTLKTVKAEPAQGAFIGGYFRERAGIAQRPASKQAEFELEESNTEKLEAQIGHPLGFLVQYANPEYFTNGLWDTDPRVRGDERYHRMPFVSWSVEWKMSDYVSGAHDRDIDATASALKRFPGPVLFRPFHEFNLCVNGSSKGCQHNGDSPDAFVRGSGLRNNQALFIAWWKYIWHRMVVVDGATNLKWVWNPSYEGPTDRFSPQRLSGFLPTSTGDPNSGSVVDVDYIGLDAYDYGGLHGFNGTISEFYNAFAGYGLPFAYVESGEVSADVTDPSNGTQCGGSYRPGPYTQARWFEDLQTSVRSSFPKLKIYSYFESWSAYPQCSKDWIFDREGLAGFISAARNPYFAQSGY